MSDRVIAVLLSAGLVAGCGAKDQRGSASKPETSKRAGSSGVCTPRIEQLERRMEVQVQGEWVTAGLFVAGCGEALASLRGDERTKAAAALKELATRDPRLHMYSCEGANRVGPDDGTVAAVNGQLGRKVLNDWCWDVLAISGPV